MLGTELFKRGPRGVTLTPAGETLHTYSLQIFQLLGEAENAVINVANLKSGEIQVGATPGISIYLLPEWILEFGTKYSNLTVRIYTGICAEIIEQLQNHEVDVGIIEGELSPKPPDWLGVKLLDEIEQKVVVGDGTPLVGAPKHRTARITTATHCHAAAGQPDPYLARSDAKCPPDRASY